MLLATVLIAMFNVNVLFQYTNILIHVLQLVSTKLPKHRTHGGSSLKWDGLVAF